ncbi:hypothetical protein BTS2_3990 [Bacillus sp. TS-2]|nr:hypothetical protein BTS2_3990 [Bacillus sp. TS-2]
MNKIFRQVNSRTAGAPLYLKKHTSCFFMYRHYIHAYFSSNGGGCNTINESRNGTEIRSQLSKG